MRLLTDVSMVIAGVSLCPAHREVVARLDIGPQNEIGYIYGGKDVQVARSDNIRKESAAIGYGKAMK
jgi:hypothetical protein